MFRLVLFRSLPRRAMLLPPTALCGEKRVGGVAPTYGALCTPATARPEGSAAAANAASHSIATGDEHAIDLPPGTVRAQASPGTASSNRLRYQYASFVCGGLRSGELRVGQKCVSTC